MIPKTKNEIKNNIRNANIKELDLENKKNENCMILL